MRRSYDCMRCRAVFSSVAEHMIHAARCTAPLPRLVSCPRCVAPIDLNDGPECTAPGCDGVYRLSSSASGG